jgi:hypothetical protein
LEHESFRKNSFQKQTQVSQGKHVPDAPALNTAGLLWVVHVIHQLCWIGLFGKTISSSTLNTLICRYYFWKN